MSFDLLSASAQVQVHQWDFFRRKEAAISSSSCIPHYKNKNGTLSFHFCCPRPADLPFYYCVVPGHRRHRRSRLSNLPRKSERMAPSLKSLGLIAATMMATASAFAPTTSVSASVVRRHAFSPLELHAAASSDVTGAPSSAGGSIVLEPPAPAVERKSDDELDSTNSEMDPNNPWILRIYNDNVNTREYVAVCLVQVVGLEECRAYYTMQDAHRNGIAKVGEYNQEIAECYEEQLIDRGIMCDTIPGAQS